MHFIGQWHDHIDTRLKLTCEYNEFFFYTNYLFLSKFLGYLDLLDIHENW